MGISNFLWCPGPETNARDSAATLLAPHLRFYRLNVGLQSTFNTERKEEVFMNSKFRTALVAFALVGGLAACDSPQRDAATAPNAENDRLAARNNDNMERAPAREGTGLTEPNRTTKGMDGSQLEEAVKSKLQGDDQLRSVDVSADAEKNAVTLKGTVPSQEARKKAVELARSAHSGITVNDEMEVKPVG
jgi:hypothetical protein